MGATRATSGGPCEVIARTMVRRAVGNSSDDLADLLWWEKLLRSLGTCDLLS